jgi:hypothetical protein
MSDTEDGGRIGEEEESSEAMNTEENGSIESNGLLRTVSYLFFILGVFLIGLSIINRVQQVIIEKQAGALSLKSEAAAHLFWRIWAAVFNANYLYLIVGIMICLLAVHIINTPRWNRIIPFAVLFAGLVAVVLVLGFIGIAFVMDWGSFVKPNFYQPFTTTLLFLVKLGAVIAIILVETPKLRTAITKRLSAIRMRTKPTEQEDYSK